MELELEEELEIQLLRNWGDLPILRIPGNTPSAERLSPFQLTNKFYGITFRSMRNTRTKILLMLVMLLSVSATVFCEGFERAILAGTTESIATVLNRTAGKGGSVSYFKPSLTNPKNVNYVYLGAVVKNGLGSAKYVMLVDKTNLTASVYQVIFKGKTVTISSYGLPDDTDTYCSVR
jgi:hypothetical protein